MATPQRILFASSQVAPFTDSTELAELVRHLPEILQNKSSCDVRIMMPRYNNISERKHHLHEVIRLSGTELSMRDQTAILNVKVASIPETRLQVYFMDNETYFGPSDQVTDDALSPVNTPDQALFFGRTVLETIGKLRWGPDILHGFGALSGLLPILLRTEYAGEAIYDEARTVYTPEPQGTSSMLTAAWAAENDLALEREASDLTELGLTWADDALYPPDLDPPNDAPQLDGEDREKQLKALYEGLLQEAIA